MIKCLSGFRTDCPKLYVFHQAAVCCRTITMSGSPEKTPPIGAFIINPLPNSMGKQTNVCAYKAKEDAGPMGDTGSVSQRKGIGDANDRVNEGERLSKLSKYDRSHEKTTGLNGDRNTLRNNNDNFQDNNVAPSVCSSLHIKADSLNTGMSQVSGTLTGIPSKESAGTSGNSSILMMKLAVSGPPKCKFDEKKTVLPQCLLQGVTELVKKEQVNQDNGSVSSTRNKETRKETSVCAESSSSFGDRQEVFDWKKEGISRKNILKIEKRNKQSVNVKENKVDDADSDNLHGNAKAMLLIDESAGIYKYPLEKHDTINVPSSDAVSSGYNALEISVVEIAADIKVSESVNLHQGEVDMSVSSKLLAETDKSDITALTKTSELAHAYPLESIESNVKEHQVEESDSVSSKYSNEINESMGLTHEVGEDDSREKSRNKVQNSVSDVSLNCAISETETVVSEQDKTLSPHSLDETDVECEVNPFSKMDFDDLLDGDFKISDVSVSSQGNKETDVGNSDAEVNELLHIDVSVLGKKSAKQVDIVYNLSDLFSGELEQRRKKELRKQKRKAKKWERFSKKDRRSVSADTTDKTETEETEEKPRKPVPNYFVAIQITDPKIKSGLKAVQDKVVSENKKLQPALNKLATLHLTMMVLNLKTEDDMERSRRALDKASKKLLSLYKDTSLELDVSGLGHFRNNVVFAKVKHEHQISTLRSVADTVEECFMEQEVISPDQRGFKPHITIMKLSSVKGCKKKGLKKIDEKLYSDFLDTDFGSENISTLQLCAMMKPKDKQGYYQVEHTVQFAKMRDSDTSKLGPNIGEISDQHVEVEKESELNVGVKSSHVKDTEVHIVENTKDVKEVDSKHDIKVGPGDDASKEALNKTSKSANLMEKNTIENNIKKETENIKSISRDNLDQEDDKSKGISEMCFKQNDNTKCASLIKEENVNTVMETVPEKGDSVHIEFAAVKETSGKIKDLVTNVTETQGYPKKLNLDISGNTRIKDIKLEVGKTLGKKGNPVTEVFKIVNHPEIKEEGITEVENKISEESCQNVIEISKDNDSALDVSVDTGTPEPRGLLNELSANDSAIDLSVNIENPELSEIDNSLDNDSVVDNGVKKNHLSYLELR